MTKKQALLLLQYVDKLHEVYLSETKHRIDTWRLFNTYEAAEDDLIAMKKFLVNLLSNPN